MSTPQQVYVAEMPPKKYTMLLSKDGIPIKHDLDEDMHAETYAIMCATAYMSAERLNSELNEKMPNAVKVDSLEGLITITPEGNNLLAVYEPKKASQSK